MDDWFAQLRLSRDLPSHIAIPSALKHKKTITRFAPSPTGELHFGHLFHLAFLTGIARALDAKIIFRMEDHDRQRCKSNYANDIIQFTERVFRPSFIQDPIPWEFQSQRSALYEEAIETLKEKGHIFYYCDCSRKDLEGRLLHASNQSEQPLVYDGHCRTRNRKKTNQTTLRMIRNDAFATGQDLLMGEQAGQPGVHEGDLAVMDNKGNWTYSFVNPVDDLLQNVTLVLRGDDLLHSVPSQIHLQNCLSEKHEVFYLHHPLVVDPESQKLSKRRGSFTLPSLLERGVSLEQMIAQLATIAGLNQENRTSMDFSELSDRICCLVRFTP